MVWNRLALSSDLKMCFTWNSGSYCAPLSRLCFAYVVEWISLVMGIQKMGLEYNILEILKSLWWVGGGGLFDFSVSLNQIYLNLD